MTPRTLSILVVVGAVALGGGWYFGSATKPAQQVAIDSGTLMFPNLAPRLKDAAKIEIVSQGKTTTLVLADGRWGLADRGGYPILDTKLRGMLTALTELRLLEPRTSDAEQLRRLGVEEPDAKDSKSSLLRLLDGSGKPILSIITGHRRVRAQAKVPEQIYVRRPGETQAWLAEGALQVDADPQLWLDRDVMNIDNKRIAGAVITRDGQTLTLARKDDKLDVTDPADHPPLDDYRVEDVGRAFEHVTFQDVQPNSTPVGDEIGRGVFTTTDGLTITATVFKAEKDILARFAVTGDDKAKEEALTLTTRLRNWTYQLGAWKEKALVPTLADLKKAEATPPAAETPPPAPVGATTEAPAETPAPAGETPKP